MEHEVGVQLPEHIVRRALREPSVLARCLPGLVADQPPVGETVSGRLKLRVGSSSITYRGSIRVADAEDSGTAAAALITVEGEQAMGAGSIAGTIRAHVFPVDRADRAAHEDTTADPSCRVLFQTAIEAKGRIEEFGRDAVLGAARRLLDRFCAAVAADPGARSLIGEQSAAPEDESEPEPPADTTDGDLTDPVAERDLTEPDLSDSDITDLDAELEANLSAELDADPPEPIPLRPSAEPADPDADWPEPAPYRRSIVGPSAEEVDHAPPRGRYAPALPARSARSRAASRWGGSGAGPDQRMGEPPVAEGERNPAPWLVGGAALLGGAVLLARRLRRR